MSSQFLVIRPDDLVVLGVRWSGFELREDEGRVPRIVAVGDTSEIIITFPPQAISEALFRKQFEPHITDTPVSWAKHAGPSHVVFRVARGTAVPLTVDGILAATGGAAIVTRESGSGLESTSIEMPYGLFVSAVARSGAEVIAIHPSLPLASESNVVGLWHTQLRDKNISTPHAGLLLKPLQTSTGFDPNFNFTGSGADPSTTMPPMLDGHRLRIVERSTQERLPTVTRFWLSPLGGTLQASAVWSNFEWDHDLRLGRDQKVRFLAKGTLYPFGHRAILSEYTERVFEKPRPRPHQPSPPPPPPPPVDPEPFPGPGPGPVFDPLNPVVGGPNPQLTPFETTSGPAPTAHAGLHTRVSLFITELIRSPVTDDGRLARQFPFDEIEILEAAFTGLAPSGGQAAFVLRSAQSGAPLQFPIRCGHDSTGDVFFNTPLVFVADDAALDTRSLIDLWEDHRNVSLPGVSIDLIRSQQPEAADVHEVHRLTLGAVQHSDGFRPIISEFEAELPALRSLLPDAVSRATLSFSDAFRESGNLTAPFRTKPIPINFIDQPARSGGLIAPKFTADVISRSLGPVPEIALRGLDESALAAFDGATLLGLPLKSLIDLTGPETLRKAPKIVPLLEKNGKPVGARMEWGLKLKSEGPFHSDDSTLTLNVERSPTTNLVSCKLQRFSYELPPGKKLLALVFDEVAFSQEVGSPPKLAITGLKIKFDGALKLLNELTEKVQELLGPSRFPSIRATPDGVSAGYSLGLPAVSTGSFVLRNIAVQLGVEVPFSNRPVIASVGFSGRDNPFSLTVMGLGGGGYIVVRIGGAGIVGFEASLEFGAMVEVNFVIVSAEVHAFGGVRFIRDGEAIELEAFIRIGGSVEVLGLVSVTVELMVRLIYQEATNKLVGRASVVVEIDVTLFSESVTLDSGEWTLVGSDLSPFRDRPVPGPLRHRAFNEWRRYQESFAA